MDIALLVLFFETNVFRVPMVSDAYLIGIYEQIPSLKSESAPHPDQRSKTLYYDSQPQALQRQFWCQPSSEVDVDRPARHRSPSLPTSSWPTGTHTSPMRDRLQTTTRPKLAHLTMTTVLQSKDTENDDANA